MDSVQNNNALSRKQARQAAATASSIIQSSDENPDEVVEDKDLTVTYVRVTGNPPPPPQMMPGNREFFQGIIDGERSRRILAMSPRTATWLSENRSAAVLAKDDIHNLSSFEEIVQRSRQSPRTFGGPIAPTGEPNAPASQPAEPAAQNWPPIDQLTPITTPFSTPPTLPVAPITQPVTQVTAPTVQSPQPAPQIPGPAPEVGFFDGIGNAAFRATLQERQKYHTFMLDLASVPTTDFAMSPAEMFADEQGRGTDQWTAITLFKATTRYANALLANQVITDSNAEARYHLEQLAKTLAEIDALPQSTRAAAAAKSMIVEGATPLQTVENIGSTLVDNPIGTLSLLGETYIEDVPETLRNKAVEKLPLFPPWAKYAITTALDYSDEYLMSQADYLKEIGLDISKPEVREALLKDPEKFRAMRGRGISRGMTIVSVDKLSGGLLEKLKIKNPYFKGGAETLQEMIAGGGGEALARYVSGQDEDWGDTFLKTVTPTIGLAFKMGGATHETFSSRNQAATSTAAPPVSTTSTTVASGTVAPTAAGSATPNLAHAPTTSAATAPTSPAPAALNPAHGATPTAVDALDAMTAGAMTPAATAPGISGAAAPPASKTPAAASTPHSTQTPKTDRIKLQDISKAAQNSSFRRRSPEDFRRLTTTVLKDTPVEHLHIPADEVVRRLKTDGIDLHRFADGILNITNHDLNVALTTGSAIKFSTVAYATDFAGGSLDAFLQEHSSFDPRTPTAAEVKSPRLPMQRNIFNLRGEPTAPYGSTINQATRQLIERDLLSRIRKIAADTNAASGSGKDHPPSSQVLAKTKRLGASANTKRYPPDLSIKSTTDNQQISRGDSR